MNILPTLISEHGRRRAEGGLHGYRSIITVIFLIGLFGVLSFTGVVRKGLCSIDAAACRVVGPSTSPTNGLEPVSLPAPSEERVVRTVAGTNVLSPGRPSFEYGKKAIFSPGAPPQFQRLWNGNSVNASGHARPSSAIWRSSVFMTLSSLPCGVEVACDDPSVAGRISSDGSTNQTKGVSKFSLLGLDPFAGREETSTVIDLNLTIGGKTLRSRKLNGWNEGVGLLYRNIRYVRNGVGVESWAWQAKDDSNSIQQVVVGRGRGSEIVSLVFYRINPNSYGQLNRVSVNLPVSDSNRDAVELWIDKFSVDGPELPAELFEPVEPVSADGNMLVRIVHDDAEVIRETIRHPDGAKPVSPQTMREDPGLMGKGVSVAKETLGESDAKGRRTFSSAGGS